MADRAALVTGGSSGIGLAIARALAEDDFGVTISGRRPDKLEAAAAELQSANPLSTFPNQGMELVAAPTKACDDAVQIDVAC